jgi:predicted nucleotidyltransferase component of viral defense system
MDLREIRRIVITALFSDDELMGRFVLKGGNALDLIYHVGTRSSLDIDLSMPSDFTDLADARERIFRALKDRFDSAGFVVFDEKFQARPSVPRKGQSPQWGGYQVDFKIAEREIHERHIKDIETLRRSATLIGPEQKRTFRIDISKFEYCDPKEEVELDSYIIYVYTLPMLAIEKLRAICQQMSEYALRRNPSPRARDFYDIHSMIEERAIDLTSPENIDLVKSIFSAKDVPLSLIQNISSTYDYHVMDWPAVRQSISGETQEFKYYFDYIVEIAQKLQTAGVE